MENNEELLLILKRIEALLHDVHKMTLALSDSQGDVIDSVYKIEATAPLETPNENGDH